MSIPFSRSMAACFLLSVFASCQHNHEIPGSSHTTMSNTPSHPHTNALIHESSPYLLQHAHNPVNWRPWSEEAWKEARGTRQIGHREHWLQRLPLVPCDGARDVRGQRGCSVHERTLHQHQGRSRRTPCRERSLHDRNAAHDKTRRLAAECGIAFFCFPFNKKHEANL